MPSVEVYTQPWCPFCARVVNLLTKKGVAFREIDAPNGTPEREEAVRRSGGATTVPQVFIDGAHVGDSEALLRLNANGELDRLLA